jgi:tungstate transport system ATP-binding protein
MPWFISLRTSLSASPIEVIPPRAARDPEDVLTADTILPLRLEAVCYAPRGRPLLDTVSVVLESGKNTVVLGPNGAGKSLLLRLCHGLIIPSSGGLFWEGPNAAQAHRYQAMVFQRPVLLRRSVAANIAYALHLRGVVRPERARRVQQALAMAGLEQLANRNARVLSGGEQQRLALARAWALQPEVLFLDEPTANLDPAAIRAVEEVITIFRGSGTKIVMTTHDLGQARRLADEVLFLHHGRLLERRPVAEFFERPQTREAQAYICGELLW